MRVCMQNQVQKYKGDALNFGNKSYELFNKLECGYTSFNNVLKLNDSNYTVKIVH